MYVRKYKDLPLETVVKSACYHCGDLNDSVPVIVDGHEFCCQGCSMVYNLLKENNLCNYYALQDRPGQTIKVHQLGNRFAWLDDREITEKIVTFREEEYAQFTFHLPSMHCSSCIWLLENFGKINPGVKRSRVDFTRKELLLGIDTTLTGIRQVVESLTLLGYEPELNFSKLHPSSLKKKSRLRIFRIGVAGFAFGNIMLLSFPSYLAGDSHVEFNTVFAWLNLVLALPVFFFSGWEFTGSAIRSLRHKTINTDVPLAIGITAVFARSVYEVVTGSSAGYFDSMTGLVFFMLIGRNFQEKSFNWLSFDRDENSYLPVAITLLEGRNQKPVAIDRLKVNDRILIKNQEIIPVDIQLLSDKAEVDYSFLTGESWPVSCYQGDTVYAGARIVGNPAEAIVKNEVKSGYINQLWNQSPAGKNLTSRFSKFNLLLSKWFILITLMVAVTGYLLWFQQDTVRALNAFTSVLVIACACALALSAPFTLGNILRILGKNGIYLKNTLVIEKLADIQTVVFDKTGTLTSNEKQHISWNGDSLTPAELSAVKSAATASNHPLSALIARSINSPSKIILSISEIPGTGIEASVENFTIRIGKPEFCYNEQSAGKVAVAINGKFKGSFNVTNTWRDGMDELMQRLKLQKKNLAVLSGDNDKERSALEKLTGQTNNLHFRQSPEDKFEYIKSLQSGTSGVLMAGDGLNDAKALLQSDVGIAVTADVNNFSPACDGIIDGHQLLNLDKILAYAKSGIRIIKVSYMIALFYNILGLLYAVSGNLSPMIAAILMPVSTSSLVIFSVLCSSIQGRRLGFRSSN